MSYELNSCKPPITSDAKLTQWNEKKSNWNKDIVLKVAAVAALILLSASLFAGALAGGTFALPVLGAGAAIGISLGGGAATGFAMTATAMVANFFDWRNYKSAKNVTHAFSKIKNAQTPLPMEYFKRLHRYGIISDSELETRKSMENQVKEYSELKTQLTSLQKKIPILEKEIEKLRNLSSNEREMIQYSNQWTALNEKISEVESKIMGIEKAFADFHRSIVDFNPASTD